MRSLLVTFVAIFIFEIVIGPFVNMTLESSSVVDFDEDDDDDFSDDDIITDEDYVDEDDDDEFSGDDIITDEDYIDEDYDNLAYDDNEDYDNYADDDNEDYDHFVDEKPKLPHPNDLQHTDIAKIPRYVLDGYCETKFKQVTSKCDKSLHINITKVPTSQLDGYCEKKCKQTTSKFEIMSDILMTMLIMFILLCMVFIVRQ